MSAMNLFVIEGWNYSDKEFSDTIVKYCIEKNIGVMINHNYDSYESILHDLNIKKNYFSLTDAPDDYECMNLLSQPYKVSLDDIQEKYKVFDEVISLFFRYCIKRIIIYLAPQPMYFIKEFDNIKKIKSTEFILMLYHEFKSILKKKHHVCYVPDLCVEIER